jgi:hypothetical protein
VNEAAQSGWLTDYQDFNQNFASDQQDGTANVDLFPDLKIDLTADRSIQELYRTV